MDLKESLCRICLGTERCVTTVYVNKERRYLPSVIYNISGVKLLQQNEPNAMICKPCADAVIAAESIIMNCQEAEEFFSHQHRVSKKKIEVQFRDPAPISANPVEINLQIECCDVPINKKPNNVGLIYKRSSKETSSSKPAPHECQHCAYRTQSRMYLVQHYREVHNLSESNMYKCSICPETFSWRRTLFMHEEKQHSILPQQKKFLCEECGKGYFKKRFLKDHIQQRHAIKEYKCPQPDCNKSFNRKFTLKRHFESMHTDVKRFRCEQCDMAFGCLDQWRYHTQSVHERKHCHKCGLWFRKQKMLDAHIQSGKCDTFLYKCPQCPRRLTTERGVKMHLQHACKFNNTTEQKYLIEETCYNKEE